MRSTTLLWILIFIIGAAARSTKLLKPVDTESWREGDMATIARNFYTNGLNILHPQVAWDGNGPGYTEAEFQLYTGITAAGYKIFGYHEAIPRIVSFVFSLGTLLVFFAFSNYLFKNSRAALASSLVFALSPLLTLLANTIQPESVMFFFYTAAAFSFLKWLDTGSNKTYILTMVLTALALLCKITSAHIGVMFVILVLLKKDMGFLFRPKTLLLGAVAIAPALGWYFYSHRFYTAYGNSLGLSNEHAWIGKDFFTNPYFIKGLFTLEIKNVWMLSGILLVLLGLFFTGMRKTFPVKLAFSWLAGALLFYLAAVRTTADGWAFYYHVFSAPAAAILMGAAATALYEKYVPLLRQNATTKLQGGTMIKSVIITGISLLLVCHFFISCIKYVRRDKSFALSASGFYSCTPALAEHIPANSLILASGGPLKDPDGYPIAMNRSYFFYWLNCKGYNIPEDKQTIENVLEYKNKGASYFVAEEASLKLVPGFEAQLEAAFKVLLKCKGVILYKL